MFHPGDKGAEHTIVYPRGVRRYVRHDVFLSLARRFAGRQDLRFVGVGLDRDPASLEAASVPDGSSLAAPSTPAGAGATGTLTCADEITDDGAAMVCIDAQATAVVVFVLASTTGSDPMAPAQVPPAVVHTG